MQHVGVPLQKAFITFIFGFSALASCLRSDTTYHADPCDLCLDSLLYIYICVRGPVAIGTQGEVTLMPAISGYWNSLPGCRTALFSVQFVMHCQMLKLNNLFLGNWLASL